MTDFIFDVVCVMGAFSAFTLLFGSATAVFDFIYDHLPSVRKWVDKFCGEESEDK